MATENRTIQLRRDTAANWTSQDPTLSAGEIGVETDTLRGKIGDGVTAWTSLGYSMGLIGTDVQAQDAELAAIAGLTSAADRVPYFTGSGTASLATFTAAGRAIAGLTSAADRVPYFTGSGTASLATFTAAGRALIDDADATAQRATLGIGPITNKNIVLNGDFQVWPEGASFTGPTNNTYTAAQWVWEQSGTGVVDVAQITTSLPTVAQAGRLITSALQVDVTTADATIAAGDYYIISTRIEGYVYYSIAQRAMVVSFWHKHTKTGTYCVSVRNSAADRSYVAEYTQSVSDTWERAEIPITASPSAGTWDYTTGIGLRLDFPLAAGATFQTTADAWQTGNFFATSSQVNGADAATNFFRIAGVQLEAGTVATEFEQGRYEDVLAATKRYYQRVRGSGISGYASTTTIARAGFGYPVEMRAAPTATLLDTTPSLLYANTSQAGSSSTITGSIISAQRARVSIDGFTGLTQGEGVVFSEDSDLLELDARL